MRKIKVMLPASADAAVYVSIITNDMYGLVTSDGIDAMRN